MRHEAQEQLLDELENFQHERADSENSPGYTKQEIQSYNYGLRRGLLEAIEAKRKALKEVNQ